MTLFLDEIPTVPGWEGFARRLMDTEKAELFLSGSSARLLSREVATSMRGRSLEVLIHHLSFRESLRHAGVEPAQPWNRLPAPARSDLDHRLRRYLVEGGFPEAQGVAASKDTLHEFLKHLADAFLIRTLSLHTSSERQRMVNLRKA